MKSSSTPVSKSQHTVALRSYGVKLSISADKTETLSPILACLDDLLPGHEPIPVSDFRHQFYISSEPNGDAAIFKNGERLAAVCPFKDALDIFSSHIRLAVAENAADRVFIHAGAVGFGDKALIMPASSRCGKTTLTAELVRRGGLYYSDEYAVLDADGLLHPFPKPLSIRGLSSDDRQTDVHVESIGGKVAEQEISVAMVLFTEYQNNAVFRPKRLSSANGLMELIRKTIPIRTEPERVLNVLRKVAESAIFVESKRGDASIQADQIVDFFEEQIQKANDVEGYAK
jgi:hypothetical protein